MQKDRKPWACWLELNREHLLHNLRGVRALVGQAQIMAVVKANAYGAGAVPIAQTLASDGVEAFGISHVSEGIELRKSGVKGSIVCLAYWMPDEADAFFEYDLTPTVFELDAARLLAERARATGRRMRVWIKIDTGLGRLGAPFQTAPDLVRQVAQCAASCPQDIPLGGSVHGQAHLEIVGLFSTMTENPERDPEQVKRLLKVRQAAGLDKVKLSLASSHGILSLRESYLDVVRPGVMLLGFEPSERERMDMALVQKADLQPVVTWKTQVGYIKVAPQGEQAGYGCRAPLAQDTPIATLTIGWADGYPPALDKGGHVLLGGRRCPIMAVSANSTLVDATGLPEVAIGDEVVLLGKQGHEEITATEMARATGSVYRLLAAIPHETPRIWDSEMQL